MQNPAFSSAQIHLSAGTYTAGGFAEASPYGTGGAFAGLFESSAAAGAGGGSGGAPSPEIRRSLAAMQCASLLREAMWSMTSELYLHAPGADYVGYTAENLTRFQEALDHYNSVYGKFVS